MIVVICQVMFYVGSVDVLNLVVLLIFGICWLVFCLVEFIKCYLDVGFNLSVWLQLFDFDEELFDGVIYYGDLVWVGVIVEWLFDEEVILVVLCMFWDCYDIRCLEDLVWVFWLQLVICFFVWW